MKTINKRSHLLPRVGVVILNWNGLEDTMECLDSLHRSTYNSIEVIVVDNGSDEDLSIIAKRYKNVHLIKNACNYGFAKGNNIGIAKAADLECKYTWILNNDTVVGKNALCRLIKVMEADDRLGAVTHLINYYYDKRYVWFSGGEFNKGVPVNKGHFEMTDVFMMGDSTQWLSGCSFVGKTTVLNKVGGFDERYFCYLEDVDISLRIKNAGYSLGFVKDAVVQHKVSRSTGKYSPIKLFYKHRNTLYFFYCHKVKRLHRLRWFLLSCKFAVSLIVKHKNPKAGYFLALSLVYGLRGKMGPCDRF